MNLLIGIKRKTYYPTIFSSVTRIFVFLQADLQTCDLKLESWSHTDVELSLEWKKNEVKIKEKSETMNQHDFAVELNSNVGGQYQSFGGKKLYIRTFLSCTELLD